jgi:dihydrofolate reductase
MQRSWLCILAELNMRGTALCSTYRSAASGSKLQDLLAALTSTPRVASTSWTFSALTHEQKEGQLMGKIVLSQNVSIDMVMQSPGPSDVPFKYRGWAVDFDRGADGDRFELESVRNAKALLLGRVTYEAMQSFWPTAGGELAGKLNALPKFVVSSTLTKPSWNAKVLGDSWPESVAHLREDLDGDVVVYGSRRLARALIERGLVDELRLLMYPLVLGTGDRLFGETDEKIVLRLSESRPYEGGVVGMFYAVAR